MNQKEKEKDIIQKSIECMANAELNNTTYEITRDIVLEYITNLEENNQDLQEEIAKSWQENKKLKNELERQYKIYQDQYEELNKLKRG